MSKDIVAALPGFTNDRFILRHGITFGSTPKEVIEAEYKNGFPHKKYGTCDYDDMLLETRFDYELNYKYEKKYEWLGEMPLYSFEYDFDKNEKKLYWVTYVFKKSASGSFFPLILAVQEKHGLPDPDCNKKAVSGDRLMRWIISENAEYNIIIDLWKSSNSTCVLSYKREAKE